MMRQEKRWPTEQWDFKDIITGDYHYVDRTAEMWQLAHQNQLVFLARPRRFGKSLLTTTFKHYFQGREELFKGLKAERLQADSGRPWESYPTLRFDISKSSDSISTLKLAIARSMETFEKEYSVSYDGEPMDIGDRFASLLGELYKSTGKQVVVLIDEYDAPLGRTLGEGQQEEHEAFKKLLRSFYSVLKDSRTCFASYC
ncbi:MAG: hypothetical protein CSA97_05985 [Bacteroidetes bacterium]|nr:MAG: hypothetical protein CSA97_05985 [Bacteroidota bacterium]